MLVSKLKIPNPKFKEAVSAGRNTYKIEEYITNFSVMPDKSLLVPRGIKEWLFQTAKELDEPIVIDDKRKLFPHLSLDSSKIIYRPYQYDAVIELMTTANEGVLMAPAGSGKTIMGLSLLPLLGQPTLWLTHTGPLATQTMERAEQFLPDIGDIGFIGGGKWKIGDTLTIGMIQTLVKNPDKMVRMRNDFGMIILDEAHHCAARTFQEVVCQFNAYFIYGLTATPYRRDKLETLMFQALGENMTAISTKKVESYGGIMLPTVVYREVHSKKENGNDIQYILTKYIVENTKRNRMITGDVLKEAANKKYCIVVSDRRLHCEALFELIKVGWEKTGIATGKYNKKHVNEQVRAFNEGEITVLVTTSALLGEGFDVPFLDRAFIAMPHRSATKTEQIIGRIQRSHPDKIDAMVYDYVDTDIGVLKNQFFNKYSSCRHRTYAKLGVTVKPY